MKKRKLKIINFLYLSDDKYEQIREYRNQEYVREVSLNQNKISPQEHFEYKKLLEKKDKHSAYLILCDDKDYGVITFKKDSSDTSYIGSYLVDENYKYEGGGVVIRYSTIILCNKLEVKLLKTELKKTNTRGARTGVIAQVEGGSYEGEYIKEDIKVFNFDDDIVKNTKPRRLFDRLYEITEIML